MGWAGKIIVALALLAAPAVAQTITDGDTLRLDGMIYRLWGIDAPERGQWCGQYPAGLEAEGALQMLVRGQVVKCEPKTKDRYGRMVAICRADGVDLGEAMVRSGMAWAFTRYSQDYVAVEAKARREGIGIHGHDCIPAWEWRAREGAVTRPITPARICLR